MNDTVLSAVVTDELTVRYGRRTAVDAVTLAIPHGSIYALLGRNGAGKSSLVRCILGLQRPTRGRATILGANVWNERAKLMQRVGVVTEEADAPPEMTVAQLAAFNARIYDRWNQSAIDARLDRFGINPKARFGNLSKGQKKQVTLALALAMNPEVLILDDPTLGLDVVARKSLFEEVIAEMADRGLTVVLTTHDLGGVEAIADRVGILLNGRLVLDEEMETLKARFRRIRFASQPVALDAGSLTAAAIRKWGTGTEAIVTNYDELAFERFRNTSNLNAAEIAPMSLEDIFIAVAGEEGAQS